MPRFCIRNIIKVQSNITKEANLVANEIRALVPHLHSPAGSVLMQYFTKGKNSLMISLSLLVQS